MSEWKDPKDAPIGKQLLVIDKDGEYYLAEKQEHRDRWIAMYGGQFVWVGSDDRGEIEDVDPVGWMVLPPPRRLTD